MWWGKVATPLHSAHKRILQLAHLPLVDVVLNWHESYLVVGRESCNFPTQYKPSRVTSVRTTSTSGRWANCRKRWGALCWRVATFPHHHQTGFVYTLLQDLTQDSATLTGRRRTKRSGRGKWLLYMVREFASSTTKVSVITGNFRRYFLWKKKDCTAG